MGREVHRPLQNSKSERAAPLRPRSHANPLRQPTQQLIHVASGAAVNFSSVSRWTTTLPPPQRILVPRGEQIESNGPGQHASRPVPQIPGQPVPTTDRGRRLAPPPGGGKGTAPKRLPSQNVAAFARSGGRALGSEAKQAGGGSPTGALTVKSLSAVHALPPRLLLSIRADNTYDEHSHVACRRLFLS